MRIDFSVGSGIWLNIITEKSIYCFERTKETRNTLPNTNIKTK